MGKLNSKIISMVALLALSGCICVGTTACEGNFHPSTSSSSKEVVSVEGVYLEGSSSINIGQSAVFYAEVLPYDATNQNVTWASSNPLVAFVDNNGVVTGVNKGTATITVTTEDGEFTESQVVTVVSKDTTVVTNSEQLGKAMASSVYQTKCTGPDGFYGVKDFGNGVGVDKSSIKELYKTRIDSHYDKVIVVDDITDADVQKYFPAQSANDYYKIATAFELAKDKEDGDICKIKFTRDKVYKCDASFAATQYMFRVDGLKDTDIEGNNATIRGIMPENIESVSWGYNWRGYFHLGGCENVLFNGLTFDQDVPSYLFGEVELDVVNNVATMTVDPNFYLLAKRLVKYKQDHGSYLMPACYTEFEYRGEESVPQENSNLAVRKQFAKAAEVTGNDSEGYTAKIYFPESQVLFDNFGVIANLLYCQYDAPAIYMSTDDLDKYCSNMKFENINIYDASGMAFVGIGVHNLYVNRYNLVPHPERGGCLSACADGSHFNFCSGELKITNSQITHCNDDSLNIKHGYWYTVSSSDAGTKSIALSAGSSESGKQVEVGDRLLIYQPSDFSKVADVTVTYIKDGRYYINVTPDASWDGAVATWFEDMAKFTFANNIVGYKRNRGILVQVPEAQIYNNTFTYVGQGAIQCATTLDEFNECTIPFDSQIYNNKFMNDNYMSAGGLYGDVSIFAGSKNGFGVAGTLTGVKINNNFVTNNGNAAIALNGAGDTLVDGNFFYEAVTSARAGDEAIFSCINDEGITISNNNNFTNSITQFGIATSGTTTEKSFSLINNRNIEFKRIEDFGPEVDVEKFNGSIIIDGDLSDWEYSNAKDIDLDGVSFADNEQGFLDDLKQYFEIQKKYITFTDSGIYIAAQIYDNYLDFESMTQFYNGDCIELLATTFTDLPDADLQVYKNYDDVGTIQLAYGMDYNDDIYDEGMGWEAAGFHYLAPARTSAKYLSGSSQVITSMKCQNHVYTLESFLPFSVFTDFKEAIDEGKRVNIALVYADNQRNRGNLNGYRLQVGNVPHFVEKTKIKSQLMPQYLFKQN